MSDGKVKTIFPPPPEAPSAGLIEEYIGGVPQGTPYWVYKIPQGLLDPRYPPAVNDMVTFTKCAGGYASYDVKKA
ncbi:MAG: hypothetical protein HYY40_08985 [Bacteroidetes bacterium]|nr:hypothetical protein [Bacteroidota bacterium]